ncbi:hypothetical protein PRIPAC_85069 [Pristionchus pacificus]|uniref:Uncharacterized protein n=1 Tax=Pristionchus pacificus TaxID=54126 RepID=A0A2A6BNS3_PRIPA|nr:hypothetical protein PRIPAC_85069 [Pristionchus pacificus]|eukprot:PDM67554.1 hypothetical protein PRIPAC_48971 [Pristionchus pacificus]
MSKSKKESSPSSFSLEKLEKELAALPADADRIKELTKRLAASEKERAAQAEKVALSDTLKKALNLSEAMRNVALQSMKIDIQAKNQRANALILKTEESKGRLEELCRELQRVNKELREENIARLRTLESERGQAVEKLRQSLADIQTTMQEGHGKSDRLAEENAKLAGRMSDLANDYKAKMDLYSQQNERKEACWAELQKAHEAEIKLLKAKLETADLMKRKAELERQELERSLLEGTARVGGAIESERALRQQVQEYSEKYTSLHKSLAQSNKAFEGFKKNIDQVNSKLAKVENEATKWKTKFDEASKNVLVLTLAKKDLEDDAAVKEKKIKMLEALCRELTGRKLKENSGESISEDTNQEPKPE